MSHNKICRICFESEPELVKICNCDCVMHLECAERWREVNKNNKEKYFSCEVCNAKYNLKTKFQKIDYVCYSFLYIVDSIFCIFLSLIPILLALTIFILVDHFLLLRFFNPGENVTEVRVIFYLLASLFYSIVFNFIEFTATCEINSLFCGVCIKQIKITKIMINLAKEQRKLRFQSSLKLLPIKM
jgi:hypothetical protein